MKKRIAIASVLKPLNDTRMTEKIASSLAGDAANEIHVIGFPSELPPDSRISFHTFPAFRRLSFARWFASFRILRIIVRIRPSILIVTTHELLFTAIVARMIFRSKIVYDVQENYYLNVLYTEAFPRILRRFIASNVRLKETLAGNYIDHFLLAEKIYASQLPFVNGRATVLENKFKGPAVQGSGRDNTRLIFSGTMSRSTGLFQAVELVRALHIVDPSVNLTLIGFIALERERLELQRFINTSSFIQVIGGNRLVSHVDILTQIAEAGAGIIAYEVNPATAGRIPTKLYEYVGSGLPVILIAPDPAWVELLASISHPFIQVSGDNPNPTALLEWLKSNSARGTFPEFMSWKNEENKLQTAISNL